MDIQILELLDGARQARGLTVVIDVFRAFSLQPWLFARGADAIIAVGDEAEARRLKSELPAGVLIGERGGRILPGFDFGNSPSQTRGADLSWSRKKTTWPKSSRPKSSGKKKRASLSPMRSATEH